MSISNKLFSQIQTKNRYSNAMKKKTTNFSQSFAFGTKMMEQWRRNIQTEINMCEIKKKFFFFFNTKMRVTLALSLKISSVKKLECFISVGHTLQQWTLNFVSIKCQCIGKYGFEIDMRNE